MILWFCYDPIEQKYENLALAKLSRAMMRYYFNEYAKSWSPQDILILSEIKTIFKKWFQAL